MDIRSPYIRTPYIGTPSIKAQSVGASLVTGATKDVIATPVIALTGNSVTITCDTTGATIYYTLDGSTPTSSSTQYSAAFTLDSSCTIKAIAIKGGKSSAVAEESYVKPITYLTQWKIVGNSEVHGNEIWSCGEYNATDGKYHILVQPQGGSIADIALTEPLRKVNDVADSIEFPSGTEGKALVTRELVRIILGNYNLSYAPTVDANIVRWYIRDLDPKPKTSKPGVKMKGLSNKYAMITANDTYMHRKVGFGLDLNISLYDSNYNTIEDKAAIEAANINTELIYELETPTTELVDAPQIEEADSYTCVISQGAKAIEWISFDTE